MALLMGGAMATVMLLFMLGAAPDQRRNRHRRLQDYMEAMIPTTRPLS
jgi:hypothetical protein